MGSAHTLSISCTRFQLHAFDKSAQKAETRFYDPRHDVSGTVVRHPRHFTLRATKILSEARYVHVPQLGGIRPLSSRERERERELLIKS